MSRTVAKFICGVVLVVAATLSETLNGQAWFDRPDTMRGNMAAFLERQFTHVLSGCNIPRFTTGGGHSSKEKSAIPSTIQQLTFIRWTDSVAVQNQVGPGRLFTYVFAPGSVAKLATPSANRQLLGVTEEDTSMLAARSSDVAYVNTCSSIVDAAAQVGTGIKLPPAAFQLALQSEYQTNRSRMIALVAGTFQSPFERTFLRGGPSALANALSFWDWWVRNDSLLSKPQYYITSFQGASFYEVFRGTRDFSGKVDLAASGGIPNVATVSGKLMGALQNTDYTNVQSFATAHYVAAPGLASVVDSAQLPDPAAILRQVQLGAYRARPDSTRYILKQSIPNQQFALSQVLDGVPPELCQDNRWSVERSSSGLGGFMPAAAKPEPEQRCRVTAQFIPTNAERAADFALFQYRLVFSAPLQGRKLTIDVLPVTFTNEKAPVVKPTDYSRQPTGTNPLKWTVVLRVDDPAGVIAPNLPPTLTGDAITCGTEAEVYTLGNPQRLSTGEVQIEVTRNVETNEFAANAGFRECTLRGILQFQRQGGGVTVPVSLEAAIKFPARTGTAQPQQRVTP